MRNGSVEMTGKVTQSRVGEDEVNAISIRD